MRYDNKREYEDELWIEQTLENNIHNTQTHAYTRCTHVHIVVNITFFETVSIYFTEKEKELKKQTQKNDENTDERARGAKGDEAENWNRWKWIKEKWKWIKKNGKEKWDR